MINELYDLSEALKNARIQTQNWHRKYKPIPNISAKAPCVRITVSNGKVAHISEVDAAHGQLLRKYGSNQGSYPCMNLAPLYRITDEAVKKELADVRSHPERIDLPCISRMKTWCVENNWGSKFQEKYRRSMKNTPEELLPASDYKPLQILIDETKPFINADYLHTELERIAWEMIERCENISLALTILFYQGKEDKEPDDDFGSLSVAFESAKPVSYTHLTLPTKA